MLVRLSVFTLACAVLLLATLASSGQLPGRLLSSAASSYGGIVMCNTDGSSLVHLTATTAAMTPSDGRYKACHPTISRTGVLAFAANLGGQGYRIYTMRADGSGLTQLTTASGLTKPAFMVDTCPAIAPDGSKVAFISTRSDSAQLGISDIFIINANGTGLRKVTTTQQADGYYSTIASLAWHTDSNRLAFRGYRRVTVNNQPVFRQVLATINADGTNEQVVKVLHNTYYTSALDWSPDGTRLVYSTHPTNDPQLFHLLTLSTGAETTIARNLLGNPSCNTGTVRFSPDNQQLVYLQYDSTTGQAHPAIINLDGSGRTVLTEIILQQHEPLCWAAGTTIPTPARLVLSPNPVEVWPGITKTVVATLYGANNVVIARAAEQWGVTPAETDGPRVASTGVVAGGSTDGLYTLTASNGGQTATALIRNVHTPIFQPDAQIRGASEAAFTGDGLYNVADAHTETVTIPYGETAVFLVRVQNDGNLSDRFTLTAPAAPAGWTVRYFDAPTNGTDITASVLGSGWLTPVLQPGAWRDLRMEIAPGSTASSGQAKTLPVTITSKTAPTKTDGIIVKATKASISSVSLGLVPATCGAVNRPTTLTASAVGGGKIEYLFRAGYQTAGVWSWQTVRTYQTVPTCTWTPSEAQLYTVVVWAREVGSTEAYQVYKSLRYTVVPPVSAVTLTASPLSPKPVNTSITLTAKPTGGANVNYQFRVGVKTGTTWTWTVLQDYAPAKTCLWRPTSTNTYTVAVYAREYGTTKAYDVYASMNFRIIAP